MRWRIHEESQGERHCHGKWKKFRHRLTGAGKRHPAFALQIKACVCYNKLSGIIAVADTVKENSKAAIEELKKMNVNVAMITGDNKKQ